MPFRPINSRCVPLSTSSPLSITTILLARQRIESRWEMMNTVRYAERIYYDRKREWNKIVDRAMAADFSWNNSAKKYAEMYDWLAG